MILKLKLNILIKYFKNKLNIFYSIKIIIKKE